MLLHLPSHIASIFLALHSTQYPSLNQIYLFLVLNKLWLKYCLNKEWGKGLFSGVQQGKIDLGTFCALA